MPSYPSYTANPYYQTQTGGINFAPNNFQTAVPIPQPQPQQTPGSIMTIFVNSEDEVRNYPVAAGVTVLLLSFNLKKFWLKSTSTNGVPELLREFPFEETTPQTQPTGTGVSREEFDLLSKKIDKLIADLGGNANG